MKGYFDTIPHKELMDEVRKDLSPLDHAMAGAGFEMVRYADDFVILCRSQEAAENHQRWPNACFTELGFFSLEVAHASACQSR